MRAHGAVDQELKQVGPQHIPVVVVVFLAFVAAHHQAADSPAGQQGFVDGQIGQVGLDRDTFLRVQRLAGLECVKLRRRVMGSSANGSGGRPGGKWSRTPPHYAAPGHRAREPPGEPIGLRSSLPPPMEGPHRCQLKAAP